MMELIWFFGDLVGREEFQNSYVSTARKQKPYPIHAKTKVEELNMSKHYKNYHISSMHSDGTTSYETVFVIIPSVFYTFITVLLASVLISHINKPKKWQFLLEFLTLVLPLILNVTVLADHIKDILIGIIAIIVPLSLLICKVRSSNIKPRYDYFKTNFLTNARAAVSVMTVIAILAVDFKIFPRRFAKTETFGYSLMDAGVGLFVFSNGILAPEARGQKDSIKKTIKSSLPLFILGGARFIFTKQIDYNVPVSEYGVHWNFFITLAFTKLFASFILNVIKIKYIFINAIFIVIAHETLLQTGLQKLALTDIERDSFVIANKEGLISCLGYVSIYLFAVYFGYLLDIKSKGQSKKEVAYKCLIGSLLTCIITIVLQNYFQVSRRLANSTYCFWIVFLCIFMLGLYYLAQIILELIFKNRLLSCMYSPLIFESVNYNGLTFFLLANVWTGLVNISLDTLTVSDTASLMILVLYMFVNCFVVTLLYNKQIKLKL